MKTFNENMIMPIEVCAARFMPPWSLHAWIAYMLAAHTSIGIIMKARNCAHRKSGETSYLQVYVPKGKCHLNKQLGNNGAANHTQQ